MYTFAHQRVNRSHLFRCVVFGFVIVPVMVVVVVVAIVCNFWWVKWTNHVESLGPCTVAFSCCNLFGLCYIFIQQTKKRPESCFLYLTVSTKKLHFFCFKFDPPNIILCIRALLNGKVSHIQSVKTKSKQTIWLFAWKWSSLLQFHSLRTIYDSVCFSVYAPARGCEQRKPFVMMEKWLSLKLIAHFYWHIFNFIKQSGTIFCSRIGFCTSTPFTQRLYAVNIQMVAFCIHFHFMCHVGFRVSSDCNEALFSTFNKLYKFSMVQSQQHVVFKCNFSWFFRALLNQLNELSQLIFAWNVDWIINSFY